MKELRRNPETGNVDVWEDGVRVGTVFSMGDLERGERTDRDDSQEEQQGKYRQGRG